MTTSRRSLLCATCLLGAAAQPLLLTTGCSSNAAPAQAAADESAAGDTGRAANAAAPAKAMMMAARFDADGRLLRPADHREWVFVGAPVTPNDMNNAKAAFPEFHNVYIDPTSFASYKRTGEFPAGTVILKELVTVGGKSMPSGNGYFQGEFVSLEAMVKDGQRFSEEPGGWAFFRFGEAPDYSSTGQRMETTSCNTCHAGATQDYVFTDTYPVLRAARTMAKSMADRK